MTLNKERTVKALAEKLRAEYLFGAATLPDHARWENVADMVLDSQSELLAACEAALPGIEKLADFFVTPGKVVTLGSLADIRDKLRAAIAKAKGEK